MAPQDAGALQDLFGVLGDTPPVAIPPERGGGCPKSHWDSLRHFRNFRKFFFLGGDGCSQMIYGIPYLQSMVVFEITDRFDVICMYYFFKRFYFQLQKVG